MGFNFIPNFQKKEVIALAQAGPSVLEIIAVLELIQCTQHLFRTKTCSKATNQVQVLADIKLSCCGCTIHDTMRACVHGAKPCYLGEAIYCVAMLFAHIQIHRMVNMC